MIKQKDIIIVGAGGLGRGLIDLIDIINKTGKDNLRLLGFVDDTEMTKINGINYLGNIDYLVNYQKEISVVIALGTPIIKKKVYEKLSTNPYIKYPNLIHPDVELSAYNYLGIGNIISKGVVLSTNIQVNDFNLIHYNCSIGHDVLIGSYASIFPLSSISGYVSIEDEVEIGKIGRAHV